MVLAVPSQIYFVKITGINVNLRRKSVSLYQLNAWCNLILRRWNSDFEIILDILTGLNICVPSSRTNHSAPIRVVKHILFLD
jgi:hypothetical protein